MGGIDSRTDRDVRSSKEPIGANSSALKQQINALKLRCDSKKQQLADDEVAQGLDAQEKKINQFGQTLNALNTFIKQKSAESDVQLEMATCLETANILNKMLLDRKFNPVLRIRRAIVHLTFGSAS